MSAKGCGLWSRLRGAKGNGEGGELGKETVLKVE